MQFGVKVSDSRAPVTNSDFLKENSVFAVFGSYVNTATPGARTIEFDGTEVTYKSGVWTYDDARYWFPGHTYDFTAVYPATLNASVDDASGKVKVVDFKADGTDVLAATHHRDCVAGAQDKVAFDFRHLLSRVTFKGRSDDRYLGADGKPDANARKIKVLSFKVSGISDTGTWDGTNFAADGSNLGGWTRGEQTATYTAPIDANGLELGNDPVDIFGSNDVILAIPQAFTALKVDITYVFTEGTQGEQTATSTLSGTWLPGKSYSYNFALNTHIFFDIPVVEDWTTAPVNNPDLNIDLPRNNP